MILIPYSKINYRTKHSIEETKRLISKETGIQIDTDKPKGESNFFRKHKGKIVGDTFELIEKKIGKDVWTLKVNGQLLHENESTKILTKVVFNYTAWIFFIVIATITLSLAAGIYLFSKLSGELNPAFWGLLKFNLFVYVIYVIAFHFKKYRNDKFLTRILSAEKIKE